MVSYWTGIGGNVPGVDSLGQAGTEHHTNSDGSYSNYAWVEGRGPNDGWLFGYNLDKSMYPVHPGDTIESETAWQNDTNSNGTADTYSGVLWNHTDNWAAPWKHQVTTASNDYTGDSAEVITERPGTGSNGTWLWPLSDFDHLDVTNAYVWVGKNGNDTRHPFSWFDTAPATNGWPDQSSNILFRERISPMISDSGQQLDSTGDLWGTDGQNFKMTWGPNCGS